VFLFIAKEHQVLLLLDALDECENRTDLVIFLSELKAKSLRTRAIITSRDEKDIRSTFVHMPRLCLESQAEEIFKDISYYVETRLNTESELRWLNAHIKAEIRQKLTSCETGSWM
jgi:hypothetical protein